MEKLLSGKTALVTGASKGIGKGIAEKLAEQGANVAFTYLSSVEKGEALEQELKKHGTKIKGYRSDASDHKAADELINTVVKEFGTLDIVVNNAGITRDGLLMRMSEEQFNDVIKTNLNSVFNVTKACQRQMLKQRNGSIINISSVVGVKGNAGQANYAASKAGIIGFTKSIALELGSRNIRCNAIAVGMVRSRFLDRDYERYRPSVEATRVDDGPLGVGSRFRVVVKTGPGSTPLVYEVKEFDPGRRIRLVAESSSLRSDDVITVTPTDTGATVVYEADLTLRGVAKVLSPFLGLVFDRIGDRAAAGLRRALDERAAEPAS